MLGIAAFGYQYDGLAASEGDEFDPSPAWNREDYAPSVLPLNSAGYRAPQATIRAVFGARYEAPFTRDGRVGGGAGVAWNLPQIVDAFVFAFRGPCGYVDRNAPCFLASPFVALTGIEVRGDVVLRVLPSLHLILGANPRIHMLWMTGFGVRSVNRTSDAASGGC